MNLVELGPPLLAALVISLAVFVQVRKWQGAAPAVAGARRDDDEEEEGADERVVVKCFFGSQTGTAEGFAKQVAKDMTKAGFKGVVVDLEDLEADDFCDGEDANPSNDREYHVYFMATYGEGDPTDNAVDFMTFLRKGPEDGGPAESAAKNVGFSVFGLGNTQYEHYNNIGKTVHERMLALGGRELHPMGLGDDDQDIEEDFDNWKEGLVDAFAKDAFGAAAAAGRAGANPAEDDGSGEEAYQFRIVFVPPPENSQLLAQEGRKERTDSVGESVDLSSRHLFQGVRCKVAENRELCQKTRGNGGQGSTVHVELDLQGTGLSYGTADNLTVCAANDMGQVEETAMYLGLSLDQWFVLESIGEDEGKQLFPTPCTIRSALAYFTDLNGAPTRSLLERLSKFVTMPEHKSRLLHLASKEGKDDFHHYVTNRKMCIAELFETYPSFKLNEDNLGGFFEVMPRLKGREFTISSSSTVQPSRVAITVGVIQEDKPGEPSGRVLKGVASTYLKEICSIGAQPLVFVKESTFKMPTDPSVPIILIGPGTGIAPMRAFLQERRHQVSTLGHDEVGETVLFFGCRKKDEDFIYKDELLQYVDDRILAKLHTAFSREQAKKVYVQHLLEREAENVWGMLEQGAHVYVCGATGMGKEVQAALVDICQKGGGLSSVDEAKSFVKDLQQAGRYIQELWSS